MRIKVLIALFLVFIVIGCDKRASQDPIQVVQTSYEAWENEDIEAYLSTVSGARADVAGTLLVKFFESYDITYTIDSIELVSQLNDQAVVYTVVTARDKGTASKFTDNITRSYHKLKKENGIWTIYFSETKKPEIIEKPTSPENVADTIR